MRKHNDKRRSIGNVLVIIGIILIIGAVALCIYNIEENRRAMRESQDILSKLSMSIKDKKTALDSTVFDDLTMPVIEIDGQSYIGTISIPSLNIELPVNADFSMNNLRISPCLYSGNYKLDDMVICAHNYASHFGPLLNIVPDDEVYFTSADGMVFKYRVSNIETVQPFAVEHMILNKNNSSDEGVEDEWDLTLFTCTLSGQTRCTVRCTRSLQ